MFSEHDEKNIRISAIHHKKKIGKIEKKYGTRILGRILCIGIIVLLICTVTISSASATTYYVAKTGSDYNPGTSYKPFKTIQKAANIAIAGDTVYVKQGIYNEKILIKNSGNSGAYINFVVYPNNNVTIDGRGLTMSWWQGLFDIYGKSYIKISGFRIVNSPQAGIRASKAHHITIEKNYIYNSELSSIKIGWGYSNNIIIDNNTIDRPYKSIWDSPSYTGPSENKGWEEAISVSNTDTVDVKNNIILRNGKGECIDLKDGTKHSKIYKNKVSYCSAVGIYTDNSYDIDIYQNIVYGSMFGIMLGSEKGMLVQKIKIYNNIVYGNKAMGIAISSFAYQSYSPRFNDIIIINNIVDSNIKRGIFIQKDIGRNMRVSNVTIRNNIASNNGIGQVEIGSGYPYVQKLFIDHNIVFGTKGYYENDGSNVIYTNPQYMNPSTKDYRPKNIAPSINKGIANNAPKVDIRNVPRPQSSNYDIGAYEYTSYLQ